MQNRIFPFGPVALTNTTTTNLLNGNVTALTGPVGVTLTQPYILIRRLRIVNKTGGAATFSLWIGATGANAAGTEFLGTGYSVGANAAFDWYGQRRLESSQFLVGGASANTTLTIEGDLEIGFS